MTFAVPWLTQATLARCVILSFTCHHSGTQKLLAALADEEAPVLPHDRCHQILAELRPPGSKEYKIPRGFLFNYVTCANYTTEIVGWVAFTIATQTAAAAIFATCGALQMGQWAIQKHMRLRKVCCRR